MRGEDLVLKVELRMRQPDVQTGLLDLSGLSLGELTDQDPEAFRRTLDDFLRRFDQPSASISGYNPQRLD